jgi:flagellar basal-body rod protein FlgC
MPDPIRFPILPRPERQLLGPLGIPARGMSTQQSFIEVIAANLANAETTRTPEGGPYRRQIAVADPAAPGGEARAVTDDSPGRSVYDPGHPDADANGFVIYPNVNVNTELVDLMIARRVFEANATVFQAAKSMLRRALDI